MFELRDEIILFCLLVLAGAYGLLSYSRRFLPVYGMEDEDLAPEPASREEALPYQKKWFVLSPAERTVYDLLRQAAGARYLVLAKVRLFDLLWVPENTKNREYYMSRVMSKRVDFALCHAGTLALALVIECEAASCLPSQEGTGRDTFVNQVLRTAGIPILRVPSRDDYAQYDLAACIEQALRRPGDVTVAGQSRVASGSHAAQASAAMPTVRA
jgi:hypothetical protein